MEELLSQWEEIKYSIKQDLGIFDLPYKTWVQPLKLIGVYDNTCIIGIPDTMDMEGLKFIESKYGQHFKTYIQTVTGKKYDIKFIIGDNDSKDYDGVSSYYNNEESKLSSSPDPFREKTVTNINNKANLNPKYTFDNFVVGKTNSIARSAALAVAEDPGNNFNPLFIWGGSGYGKTHLMHAIGHEVLKRNPEMNIMYVTSEMFTNEVIEAIRLGNQTVISKFRDKYRSLDLLLFDDVQFLEGKESTQEEFFYTFNELHSSGKAIIISSDKPPKNLTTLAERIKNRFNWGITVDIGAPDYETRLAILRKNAELNYNSINISDDILQYLATKVHSNVRELEGALNNVVLHHRMKRENVMTIETVDEAIKDIISPDDNREINIPVIRKAVCDYFDIEESKILSSQRDQKTADVRMIIMYLSYEMTNSSKKQIGEALNRNHATVIHGIDKVKENLKNDEAFFNQITEIRKIINNG